jgi:hypothetical protein
MIIHRVETRVGQGLFYYLNYHNAAAWLVSQRLSHMSDVPHDLVGHKRPIQFLFGFQSAAFRDTDWWQRVVGSLVPADFAALRVRSYACYTAVQETWPPSDHRLSQVVFARRHAMVVNDDSIRRSEARGWGL